MGEWGRGGQGEWAQGQALADFLHHPRTLALTPSEMGSIEDFEERRDRSAVVSSRPKETRGVGGSCDMSGRGVSTAATRAVAAAAWTGGFVLVTPCRGNWKTERKDRKWGSSESQESAYLQAAGEGGEADGMLRGRAPLLRVPAARSGRTEEGFSTRAFKYLKVAIASQSPTCTYCRAHPAPPRPLVFRKRAPYSLDHSSHDLVSYPCAIR